MYGGGLFQFTFRPGLRKLLRSKTKNRETPFLIRPTLSRTEEAVLFPRQLLNRDEAKYSHIMRSTQKPSLSVGEASVAAIISMFSERDGPLPEALNIPNRV